MNKQKPLLFVQVSQLLGIVQRVLIWRRHLSPINIANSWLNIHLTSLPGLALGWLINPGYGNLISDIVRSHRLTASISGTTWVHISLSINVYVAISTSRASLVYTEASSFCSSLFQSSSISGPCGSLTASASFYSAACAQDIVSGQSHDWSMSAVVTFATQCKTENNLATWPAQLLCNSFPSRHFPLWVGKQCNLQCVFGQFDDRTQSCQCDNGYIGEKCDTRCPGYQGKDPCNGHGKCDQDTGRYNMC